MSLILQGCAVGFSIAAPVGVIGFLCIQQTLRGGMKLGFATGLGAATADTLYGVLVAVGMSSLQQQLLAIRTPLSLIGGLFLCYLGIKKIMSKPNMKASSDGSQELVYAYVSTFFLTVVNPGTILDFLALFTGLSIDVGSMHAGLLFVAGVFLGSALWWLLLSFVTALFRHKISELILQWVNRFAGAAIFSFGLWAIYKSGAVL